MAMCGLALLAGDEVDARDQVAVPRGARQLACRVELGQLRPQRLDRRDERLRRAGARGAVALDLLLAEGMPVRRELALELPVGPRTRGEVGDRRLTPLVPRKRHRFVAELLEALLALHSRALDVGVEDERVAVAQHDRVVGAPDVHRPSPPAEEPANVFGLRDDERRAARRLERGPALPLDLHRS
jgi:hypothetical protein